MDAPKIAIIGAGVVGFTTANILQDEIRGANITLIADKFKTETTSSVAAGIFRPGLTFRGPTKEITKKWVNDSWHYWQDILTTSDASLAGVMSLSSYIFSNDNPGITKNHLIEDLVPVYRAVNEEELKICEGDWKYGAYYSTILTDANIYLPYIENKFTSKGGNIIKERIDSFASLVGRYDLIFNCTGLGAKLLCDDYDLVPIRGQVIKVKAPWLKTAFYVDYDTYIIPGFNGVATLGGTRQYDSSRLQYCRHDAAAILERCTNLLPRLKKAEIVAHKVGLRPHRTPVRVEAEVLPRGLKVVHCYGHGGYGVTCAPGTASHAVRVGLDVLKTNFKNKL